MKKWNLVLAGVLACATVLTGCGSTSGTNSQAVTTGTNDSVEASAADKTSTSDKDSLVVALQGEPSTLDAQYADDTNMFWVTWQINEPLVMFNGDTLEIEPVLATEWTNVDQTTWQFTIREGVKFHDGSDFTVEDAVYSVNRIVDPAYGSQFASDFSTIVSAEAVDDKTFTITTNGPDPILLQRLTKLYMVDKETVDGKSNEVLVSVANGTGPYKFVAWERGKLIDLAAFDSYWGDAPAITNITFRFIEEASTRVSALQTGEINIAVNMLPEYVEQLPQVVTGEGMENYFMRFNTTSGIMANADLRLACNYAIDKEGIAESLFLGYATPEPGQIASEGTTGYTSGLEAYPYDVEKAKELIAKSGYNGETIELVSEKTRWTKDGEVTEAVAAMLQEVGLNVEVKFVSWNEWLDILFDKSKTPDLMFSSTSNEFRDVDRILSSQVHSSGTQSAMDNAEYDALIDEARTEMDAEKRQAIYNDLNTRLYDDPPKLYLISVDELHGASADLNWSIRKDCRVYFKFLSYK